jgi:hypothetical protein
MKNKNLSNTIKNFILMVKHNGINSFVSQNLFLMKKLFILIFLFGLRYSGVSQGILVSSSPGTAHSSAMLEVQSSSLGMLVPRMTTAQRDAINSAATGLVIYNTDTNKFNYYNMSWIEIATTNDVTPLSKGGTSANLTASNGGIFYSTASSGAILSGTSTANKMLLSGSNQAPTWSTSTIPTSAGSTANKVLVSDGTNYVLSTPTFPNASATSGKIITSDGTNWIASTPTYPQLAGTSGNVMVSDGTNFVSGKLSSLSGAVTADVTMSNANTYYDGPSLTLTAGTWLLVGTISIEDDAINTDFSTTAKLWDGTNVESTSELSSMKHNATGFFGERTHTLMGIVSVSSNTVWKISAASTLAGTIINATNSHNGVTNKASVIDAVRIGN